MIITLSLLIGIIAGLRAMTAPAAVSWAAYLGWLPLGGTPLAFLGHVAAPYILTRAGHRRADHRPAAEDTQPQGAGAVRHPHRHRRSGGCGIGRAGRHAGRRARGRCRGRGDRHAGRCGGPRAAGQGLRPRSAGRPHRRRDRDHRRRADRECAAMSRAVRCHRHRRRAGRAGTRRASERCRHERGADRAQAVRRHLREHRLHAHQGPGGQRARRAHRAARVASSASTSAVR